MFPGQWREMREQLVRHDRTAGSECFHGPFEVDGIPEHNRCDDEVQSAGTEPLVAALRPPTGNCWASEDDVVPSPQWAANGCRCWALMIAASP